jgi:hypothetical protein
MNQFIIHFFLISLLSGIFADSPFLEKEHCVAWKTKKRLFLLQNLDPVGKNCKITTQATSSKEGFILKGVFPIKGFDSAEPTRDEHVFEILQGPKQADLVFTSQPIKKEDLSKLANSNLSGTLLIGGSSTPLTFEVTAKKDGKETIYTGVAKTKFSQLGIADLSVAGGVVTKVSDDLELHFQFYSSQIAGHP